MQLGAFTDIEHARGYAIRLTTRVAGLALQSASAGRRRFPGCVGAPTMAADKIAELGTDLIAWARHRIRALVRRRD